MKRAILLTQSGLELPCIILPIEKQLFPIGKEVLVYCQNRLAKGYIESDEDYVAELSIEVEFCIIPELNELLIENQENVQSSEHEQWF